MRCNNCGWDNPIGVKNCQKCNQPLEFSSFQPMGMGNNPRATMVDTQQVSNPRATMVDTQQVSNPRATMVDTQQVSNPRATMVDTAALEKDVVLFCMDDQTIGEIRISSTIDLGLVEGDIILVKNLRYKVK